LARRGPSTHEEARVHLAARRRSGLAARGGDAAAGAKGAQIQVFNASTSREIDAAFAALVRERLDALFVSGDGFFNSRHVQLVHLATRHAVPTTYAAREIDVIA